MNGGLRSFDLEDRLIRFSASIIDVVEQLPDGKVGGHIAGQLLRGGTASAPNYAEALGAESRRDFVHKLKVGLKELRETAVWLSLIEQKQLVPVGAALHGVRSECHELTAIFVASIATAQRNMISRGEGRREYRPERKGLENIEQGARNVQGGE